MPAMQVETYVREHHPRQQRRVALETIDFLQALVSLQ
jgi:hypothetical protein